MEPGEALGIAVGHHQTDAARSLGMVQRYRIRGFFALRHHHDATLSSFGCATDSARTRYSVRFLCIRDFRDSNKPVATVQCCVPWRILAVFRRDRIPTYHWHGPIYPYDPFAAGIERPTVSARKPTPQARCHEDGHNRLSVCRPGIRHRFQRNDDQIGCRATYSLVVFALPLR